MSSLISDHPFNTSVTKGRVTSLAERQPPHLLGAYGGGGGGGYRGTQTGHILLIVEGLIGPAYRRVAGPFIWVDAYIRIDTCTIALLPDKSRYSEFLLKMIWCGFGFRIRETEKVIS